MISKIPKKNKLNPIITGIKLAKNIGRIMIIKPMIIERIPEIFCKLIFEPPICLTNLYIIFHNINISDFYVGF